MGTDRELEAVERASAYGFDISLIESSLALTPTERLIRNEGVLALARAFARTRVKPDVAHRRGPQAPARRPR